MNIRTVSFIPLSEILPASMHNAFWDSCYVSCGDASHTLISKGECYEIMYYLTIDDDTEDYKRMMNALSEIPAKTFIDLES